MIWNTKTTMVFLIIAIALMTFGIAGYDIMPPFERTIIATIGYIIMLISVIKNTIYMRNITNKKQ